MTARAWTDDSREFLRHEHADLNHAIEDEAWVVCACCGITCWRDDEYCDICDSPLVPDAESAKRGPR